MEEQDIQDVCDLCCDGHHNVHNEDVGEVFQWLINNDYKIFKQI